MEWFQLLNNLYGDIRGFNRSKTRQRVASAANKSSDALRTESLALFSQRVHDAVSRFPAYAQWLTERGVSVQPGQIVAPEDIPVWTKPDQVAFFKTLTGPPVPNAYQHSSGGSTGVPSKFYVTRESYEYRTAVWDRAYGMAGAQPGVRSIHFWSSPLSPPPWLARTKRDLHQRMKRRKMVDILQQQTATSKEASVSLLESYRPEAVVSFAHYLVALSIHIRDRGRPIARRVPRVMTASEWLPAGQREIIQEHLAEQVFLSYGCREFMSIGMECSEHRGYHLNIDNLWVEVVDDQGHALPPGRSGRVVVTDLHNVANPFIRYDLTDVGVMAPDEPCPCGCPFPILADVEGRVQDVIVRDDGERMSAMFLNYIARDFDFVDGYQLVQHAPGRVTFKLVTSRTLVDADKAAVVARMRERLGPDMDITVAEVAELTRKPNGKVAFVVSEMD